MRTRSRRNAPIAAACAVEQLEGRRLFAFGVTSSTAPTGQSTYVVDNGANLKFAVIRGGSTTSTIHLGDVTSIKYKNVELLAPYSTTSRYSHYEQGLSSTTGVTYATGGATGSRWILVTCDDSAISSGAVIQYYAVRENDDNLYMASLPIDVTNGPGEGRFIAYLDRGVFKNPEAPSDNAGNVGAVEGSDVFYHADGHTTSKFYNMGRRMIENEVHGLTGTSGSTQVGAWMHMGNRERSAGGPFFKDIDFQADSAVEIYNCIFTGHTQTESYRQGLHTYAMQFNGGGSAPAAPNYSVFEQFKDVSNNLLIQGLIPASQRGAISGTATGNAAGHETVVGLSNASAQYWTFANADGTYSIPNVLPGTYTQTLYDNELEVGTKTVTVVAGKTTSANIVNAFYQPSSTIWRIGTWDGTPAGFLNADKIEVMHPSDVRMSSWTATPNFVIGTNTDAQFPMAEFMDVNNGQRITFNLTSAQVQNLTLRVGITLGFAGARPRVTVNAGQSYAWTSGIPNASDNLNSRGVTRGTWRGNNQLYAFTIPSSAFRAGTNTIDLPMVSGSSGVGFLSPNAVFDAIDLVPTTVATPSLASVAVTPANASVGINSSKAYAGTAKNSSGATVAANLNWSATRGTIDANGNYVAPSTAGSDTVVAVATITQTKGYTIGSNTTATAIAPSLTVTGSTGVTVTATNAPPTIATAASATPNPSYTKQATLVALGADDGGEANLTYTWSAIGANASNVTFAAANGTNAGKSTTSTFASAGSYTLQVTITDAAGLSVTSQTVVVVKNGDTRYLADETGGATLADATGNGNAATLTGATAFAAGVNGNAVKLSGGYASLPAGVVSGLNDFTIAAWVKPDAIANWQRIFDFGSSTTSYMFLATRPSTTGGLRFAFNNGSGEQQVSTSAALTVGAWQHVAVRLSGNTATVYLNGVAVGSNANVTLRPSSLGQTTNNYIGKSQFSNDPALQASVDDFQIVGRALTNAEIAALATPAAPANVVATAGDAQVGLTWDAAAGATSYVVRRATVSGGPYTIVGTPTGTSFTDAGLANGTTYYYVIGATNAGGAVADSAEVNATPAGPAPTISSFAVNDGSAQRSMVRSLTLTFSGPVTLGNGAISLRQNGNDVAFDLSPANGPSATYVLTFSGSGIVGGSLGDGFYTLSVTGSGVTAAGGTAMAGNASYAFHRLFGDSDGDLDVDNLDSLRFRTALGSLSGASAYRDYFDFDSDGDVDNLDSLRFRTRLGTNWNV